MAEFLEEYFANIETNEGTVAASANVSFSRQSAKLIVTNDSATKDLIVKMKPTTDGLTLKPTETLTIHYRTRQIALIGSNVDYRVWAFG